MPRASRVHTSDAQRRDQLIRVDKKRRQDGSKSLPRTAILRRPTPKTTLNTLQAHDLFPRPGPGNQDHLELQAIPRPAAIDLSPAGDAQESTANSLTSKHQAELADHVLEPTPKQSLSAPRRYRWDYQDSLQTIEQELLGHTGRPASPKRPIPTKATPNGPQINISMISATSFHFNI
jgi:hypothetical protein